MQIQNRADAVVRGTGSTAIGNGAVLVLAQAAGIAAAPAAAGEVQTTTRSFSPDATYVYNGTAAQTTGTGLPGTVRGLTVNNPTGLTLTNALRVSQLVYLESGNLTTGTANNLTLLSAPANSTSLTAGQTALIDNTGGIVAGTNTNNVMQRAVDNVLTGDNIGYHHYSSPMVTTTVGDLTAPGFAPVLNDATSNPGFNSARLVGVVRPFPTVFGYDETRVGNNALAQDQTPFNQGYFAPANAAATWVPGKAYSANVANAVVVDFVGQFNNAPTATTFGGLTGLTRGGTTDSGWQLLGNPFPAPLDFATVATAQFTNMLPTVYQYHATSRYGGFYTAYQVGTGVGQYAVVPAGGGFFARVSTGTGSLSLSNANRRDDLCHPGQLRPGRCQRPSHPAPGAGWRWAN